MTSSNEHDTPIDDAAAHLDAVVSPDEDAARLDSPADASLETPERDDQVGDQEGTIAADFIEELLDILDLDGDLEIVDGANGRTTIVVDSSDPDDLKLLSAPATVSALQELTRLAVQTKTSGFSRVVLDIGGSRDARERELTTMVTRAIERLSDGAVSVALAPMSSYERKLVHDIVSERGYHSESEGEGRDRHTVITKAA